MAARSAEKASDTTIQPTVSGASPKRKALGLVWVVCPYPVLARGLEESLKEEAQVHLGPEPPKGATPSSIIFCPDEAGSVASEVKRLQEAAPQVPILIFAPQVDLRIGRAAIQAGVSGYVHAGMQPAQIVSTVSLVSAGEAVIPKELLGSLVAGETPMGSTSLTPRQGEILALVAEGATNAEIARRVALSEHTIKQHLRHAYKALKVKNRTEAARLWSSHAGSADPAGD